MANTKSVNRVENLIKMIDYGNQAKGADKVPRTKLTTNGVTTEMPLVGLGTWKQKPDYLVTQAVECALRVGYRHLDCAYVYGNEKGVGDALRKVFNDKKIKRDDVFITTKVWNNAHETELVPKQCRESLKLLGLKQVDLYLVHWPHCYKSGKGMFPRKDDGTMEMDLKTSLLDTWRGMEKCVELGLTKHIGISNFNVKQVQTILKGCKIKPVVNQIERHPYLQEPELLKVCKDNNILITAYAPLGSGDRPFDNLFYPVLMKDRKLINLANKIGQPVAKVLLRWALQSGCAVIPKSKNPVRIKSNIELFDFTLSDENMAEIKSMDRNLRMVYPVFKHPKTGKLWHRDGSHPDYPFKDTKIYQSKEEFDVDYGDSKEEIKDDKGDLPECTVKYFAMGGRAQSIRYAFAIGGVSFKDEFMNGEMWGKYKAADKPKWSGCPEMEVKFSNGKTVLMSQSNSLTRYAGKISGLYPKDNFKALQVDEYMDAVEDMINVMVPSFREQDEKKRLEMRKKLVEDETPKGMVFWLKRLNKRLQENEKDGYKNGYLVGNSITVADLKTVTLTEGIPSGRLDGIPKDLLDKIAPRVAKLIKLVNGNEKIVAFKKKFDANCAAFGKDTTKNKYSY